MIELLAILAVVALLISLTVPALSRTEPTGKSVRCLSNLKRLTTAWQMYAVDNNNQIITVAQGSSALGGVVDSKYGPGWAMGWLDWTTSKDNTNYILLVNDRFSKLARYLSQDASLFQCPADTYVSSIQRVRGWTRRVRSYSANLNLGDADPDAGPWDAMYKRIRKTSDFAYPSAGETYVFLDEHPDSINDPGFFAPHQTSWIDLPASYHHTAGGFSFADGHAEMHRWRDSLTTGRATQIKFTDDLSHFTITAKDADRRWVSYHAGRSSPNY